MEPCSSCLAQPETRAPVLSVLKTAIREVIAGGDFSSDFSDVMSLRLLEKLPSLCVRTVCDDNYIVRQPYAQEDAFFSPPNGANGLLTGGPLLWPTVRSFCLADRLAVLDEEVAPDPLRGALLRATAELVHSSAYMYRSTHDRAVRR